MKQSELSTKYFTSAFLLIILTLCSLLSSAQAGQWVWLHGSNVINDPGNFGTQGTPSPTNDPPGLYESCEWKDTSGNFWLYGGVDHNYADHNDLWRYNPVTNEWTWMTGTNTVNDAGSYGTKGIPSASNRPPSKGWGPTSWVDNNGDFWLFGGMGAGIRNDLWRYNIASDEWTWISGTNFSGANGVYGIQNIPDTLNYPGARYETAAAWVTPDVSGPGYLWLFGGYSGGGSFNDLWRYRISTNEWTWISGANVTGQAGNYGTKGVAAATNVPGCREVYTRWKDSNGIFWIFGGGAPDIYNARSDLWNYNPATNNWTWISGPNTALAAGVYGTKCITDTANIPGARFENRAAWMDNNGNFWIFGGGVGGTFNQVWNDLWMYCVATNQWTWEGGDNVPNTAGNWGTKGIASPTNVPNPRAGAISWTDGNNHLYLFGGTNVQWPSNYNDIWMYTIDPSCGTCSSSLPQANFNCSDTAFCTETGECINFFDLSTGNPTSWQWTFTGASPGTSTQQNPTNICYSNPGTYPVTLIVANSAGHDTLAVNPLIIFATPPPPPTITVIGADTLISSHSSYYQWYFNGALIAGATDSFYIATLGGTYAVQVTDSLGCNSLSNGVFITGLSPIPDPLKGAGITVRLYPNPVSDELIMLFDSPASNPLKTAEGDVEIVISNMVGQEIETKTLEKSKTTYSLSTKELSNGLYLLRIAPYGIVRKFVVMHK